MNSVNSERSTVNRKESGLIPVYRLLLTVHAVERR
jgi:hypothetical protein